MRQLALLAEIGLSWIVQCEECKILVSLCITDSGRIVDRFIIGISCATLEKQTCGFQFDE